ncbi:MAG TPA: DUF1540 domain-containing protein [Eubacteriales bacterium]|jgi:hypothetical protein|nr:DUF1540 domain-containing protein [Clostridia bacterium]HRR90404.1 DUF1540 domain-containing protein [Eubacteriales bacterium]HRU84894.1 DUF1540 domain-containing protein [Eubacteriales bacterium]
MKNLICHTNNCEHNIKSRCTAGIITISDHARCLSKIRRDGGILAQAFADVEAGADFDMMSAVETAVQCNFDCVHNSKHRCTLDHITVDDTIRGTICKTRIKERD